jgi:hypothetical protein
MNIKKDDPVEPGYCEINPTRFLRLLRYVTNLRPCPYLTKSFFA